jgi:hypothetical protein
MADATTDLTSLYNPIPIPAPLGEGYKQSAPYVGGFTPTMQAMTKSLSGSDPSATQPILPLGSGSTMYGGAISAEDIASVGGVTQGAPTPDLSTFIPEAVDLTEVQTSEFAQADQEGGKEAARDMKVEDRRADRGERKATFYKEKQELKQRKQAGDITGQERREGRRRARQGKRARRKGERSTRKDSWKNYKSDKELDAIEGKY